MGKLWAIRGDGKNSPATFVTEELILSIQSLCRAEVLKTAVIELFCSMSRLRSKNVSSLSVTVSHLKHLVSLVNIPYISKIKIIGSSPRVKKNIASIGNAHKSMLAQMKGISPGSIYGPM